MIPVRMKQVIYVLLGSRDFYSAIKMVKLEVRILLWVPLEIVLTFKRIATM